MALVIFAFKGVELRVQCLMEDKREFICKKYASKINMNINSLYFLYGGNQIDFKLKYNEQVNAIDKQRNVMNILVYKKEDKNKIKCPKCGEIINIDILDNIIKNNENGMLKELKCLIENIMNINDINKIKNQMKIIKIVIENIIKENEKNINNIRNMKFNKRNNKKG